MWVLRQAACQRHMRSPVPSVPRTPPRFAPRPKAPLFDRSNAAAASVPLAKGPVSVTSVDIGVGDGVANSFRPELLSITPQGESTMIFTDPHSGDLLHHCSMRNDLQRRMSLSAKGRRAVSGPDRATWSTGEGLAK